MFSGFVIGLAAPCQVVQEDHRIGLGNRRPAACDADALDFIDLRRLAIAAQAGGVDDVQWHALDLDRLADLVAGGAGDGGDDRQFGAGQRVQQRTLAHVGLAGQHHLQAFAQQCALARAGHHAGQARIDGVKLALGIRTLQKVDLLFRKIERGLDQHAQPHDVLAQLINFARERARQ